MDYDWLMQAGREHADSHLSKNLKDSYPMLKARVMEQRERCRTALGPAVCTSVAMAAQGTPGSTVVICTDGMSNSGIGQASLARNEEDFAAIDAFYAKVGNFAKECGVTINVIAIQGDECNLQSISNLCEMTGGAVERVNPADLTKTCNTFMSKPVIASNVVCKVKLHKGLAFRNENPEDITENQTLLTRSFGNVNEDVLFNFEYTVKAVKELLAMEDLDLAAIKEFPF